MDEFELTAPTKTGYTFDKWSCDNDKVKIDGNKVTISSGITENIMITAKWKSNGTKLLDPNGKDIGTFKTDDSLSYTISYDNSGEAVADAIVAYWLGSDSNHYYDGNTVTADVETLQAVLMTEETPMEINSIVQMTKLAEMVSAVATATDTDPNEDYDADADADTNASKWVSGYYKLVSDLSLDSNWNGIGTADSSFTGSFDGNGETITYANATHSLFNNTSGATIKKLTVMGELNGTDAFVGGIVGSANDTNISDVNLSGVKISGSSDSQCYVGGIAGSTNGGTITAETNGYGMINGCVITATVSQSSASAWSGGVVGTAMHTNISKLNVSGGKITATGSEIYGSICVGGAVGVYNADSSGCSINTVNVSGVSISATGKENTDTCAGGIIGNALIFGGNITVKNCSVAGLPDCKAEATGSIANVNSAGIIGLLLYGSSTSVMIEQPMVNSSSFTAANSTEDCDPAIVATVVGKIVSTTSGSIVISGYITNEVTLSGTTGDTVHKLYGELPDGENVEDDSDNQKLTITFNP